MAARSKTETRALDRRAFLTSLGAGAGAAAVVAGIAVQPTPAAASESTTEKKKARYRESDHVKAYYRTNRY